MMEEDTAVPYGVTPDTVIPTRTVPPEIDRELTIRLYRWALQDAEREITHDFPLVRTIQNGLASGFLAYCETLPKDALPALSRARVKAFHSMALSYLEETMTSEEQRLMEESYRSQLTYKHFYTEELNKRFGPDSVYSTKAQVTPLIKKAMRPAFGERSPSRYKVVSVYENDFSQGSDLWRLQTRIGVLDKHRTLRYAQSLYLPDREWALAVRHPSHSATDILGWLGIAPMTTYWDIPFADDVEQAVASLVLVCEHYLHAVPTIIEGLSL